MIHFRYYLRVSIPAGIRSAMGWQQQWQGNSHSSQLCPISSILLGGDADKVHIWDLSTMLNKSTPRLSSPCDGGPHVLLLLLVTPQVMEHTLFAHLNEQHLHTFTGSRLQIWFWNTRTFVNTSHFGAVFFSTMPASCVMLNVLHTLHSPLHFLFLHKWNFPLRIIWIIWDFSFYAFCIAHTWHVTTVNNLDWKLLLQAYIQLMWIGRQKYVY